MPRPSHPSRFKKIIFIGKRLILCNDATWMLEKTIWMSAWMSRWGLSQGNKSILKALLFPNTSISFSQQMILNIKHILWLYCLCEAASATSKFWMGYSSLLSFLATPPSITSFSLSPPTSPHTSHLLLYLFVVFDTITFSRGPHLHHWGFSFLKVAACDKVPHRHPPSETLVKSELWHGNCGSHDGPPGPRGSAGHLSPWLCLWVNTFQLVSQSGRNSCFFFSSHILIRPSVRAHRLTPLGLSHHCFHSIPHIVPCQYPPSPKPFHIRRK